MKSFDRVCVYIVAVAYIALICAIIETKLSLAICIVTFAVATILIVYENALSRYEEKAEKYRKMFLKQTERYMECLNAEKHEANDYLSGAIEVSVNSSRIKARQKSGVDKTKVS